MPNLEESYDIVVVGAGHAGCRGGWRQPDWDLRPSCLQSAWTVSR